MKCPICSSSDFFGLVTAEVQVEILNDGESWMYSSANVGDDIEKISKLHGPYTCKGCGQVFERLPKKDFVLVGNEIICENQNCPLRSECANHTTAGEFRTEGGLKPNLIKSGKGYICEQTETSGSGLAGLEGTKWDKVPKAGSDYFDDEDRWYEDDLEP